MKILSSFKYHPVLSVPLSSYGRVSVLRPQFSSTTLSNLRLCFRSELRQSVHRLLPPTVYLSLVLVYWREGLGALLLVSNDSILKAVPMPLFIKNILLVYFYKSSRLFSFFVTILSSVLYNLYNTTSIRNPTPFCTQTHQTQTGGNFDLIRFKLTTYFIPSYLLDDRKLKWEMFIIK